MPLNVLSGVDALAVIGAKTTTIAAVAVRTVDEMRILFIGVSPRILAGNDG
jgi:hypothetical protein